QGIAQGLEGEEGDPDREGDVERERGEPPADRVRKGNEAVDEEVEVLEVSEQGQVPRQAQDQPQLPFPSAFSAVNPGAAEKLDDRGNPNDAKETPIPASVKEGAGQHQESVLVPVSQMPVNKIDDEEEG